MLRLTTYREYTIELFLEQKNYFFIYSCLHLRGLNIEFLSFLKVFYNIYLFYLFLLSFFFLSFWSIYIPFMV